ncbi:MAG: hypothetical protein HY590_02740 [Candidatus Omnitrophica bacterium]|nr:hypothetical protein [Candidatus Omnitrophota bacterium]
MKIGSETRWVSFLFIFMMTASVASAIWVYRGREKALQAFQEREESLLQTITSLKEELSKAKAMGLELEGKLQELGTTLDRKNREVEELKTKYSLSFQDKKSLERELMKVREEKLSLEGKVKQLQSNPFLAKLVTEKKGFDQDVEGLKKTIEESRGELTHITEERNALEARLEEIQTAKVKIEEKLRQQQGKIEAMASDLEKEKAGRLSVAESLSENFARVKREKETLERELSRVSQEKIGLEQEMDQVRSRLQEINEKRDQMATQVKEINQVLETRLREIEQIRAIYEKTIEESRQIARVEKEVVELPPIIVKGELSREQETVVGTEPVVEHVQKGKVVTVNEKYRFVVIDLGRDHGIQDGMTFHVYREGQEVGLLRVTEARQKISACDIVKVIPPTAFLREGDLVIQ